ncbi:hypothetical protein ABZ311_35195, partial [Streptomyces sp. NPDC006183]
DPTYWTRHIRETVRFADTIHTLRTHHTTTFLEVSPVPVLSPAVERVLDEVAEDRPAVVVAVPDPAAVTAAVGRLYVTGAAEPDWAALFPPGTRPAPVPTYAFQRQRYWLSPSPEERTAPLSPGAGEHPVLGAGLELADGSTVHTARLSAATHAELADRELAAGGALLDGAPLVLTRHAPLRLPAEDALDVQLALAHPDVHGHRAAVLHSRPVAAAGTRSGPWRRHAEAVLPAVAGCAPDAALYRVDWIPLPTGEAAREPVPAGAEDLLFTVASGTGAREAAEETLARVQRLAAEEGPSARRLVVVTSRAVAVGGEPLTEEPGAAAARGLVRTAQSERPGRFVLLDTDGSDASTAAVPAALATGEPELVLRAGTVYVPRLVQAGPVDPAGRRAFRTGGTVLITGGTGALGTLVARHLVT